MLSFTYLAENFLSLDQLAGATGTAAAEIEAMVAAGCLPGPAYHFSGSGTVRSFFGEHEEAVELAFFPPSHIARVKQVNSSPMGWSDLAAEQRDNFFAAYAAALEELGADRFGLASLFGPDGRVGGSDATAFLEKEWQSYLDGTYGLCTRSASVLEIATKEAMIARIKLLCAQIDGGLSSPFLLNDLAQAVDMLDRVSAPFAPHERVHSSRHRYIDMVRDRYLSQPESESSDSGTSGSGG